MIKKINMLSIIALIFLMSVSFAEVGKSFDTPKIIEFTNNEYSDNFMLVGEEQAVYKVDLLKGESIELSLTCLEMSSKNSLKPPYFYTSTLDEEFKEILGASPSGSLKDGGTKTSVSFNITSDQTRYFNIKEKYSSWNELSTFRIDVKRSCIEGYTDEYKNCVNGTWEFKDIIDVDSGKTIKANECIGCIYTGKCYSVASVFDGIDNKSKYCSIEKKVENQIFSNGQCMDDYQCHSYLTCVENTCLDMRKVLDNETGKNIYGKDCEACLIGEVCYGIGSKLTNDDNKPAYCSTQKEIKEQKKEEETCNEHYECLDKLICLDGFCADTKEVKKYGTNETIYAGECIGCVSGDYCYKIGNRFLNEDNEPVFCSIVLEEKTQKEIGLQCNENYECTSNECNDGKCVSTINIIQQFINMLLSLFGIGQQ